MLASAFASSSGIMMLPYSSFPQHRVVLLVKIAQVKSKPGLTEAQPSPGSRVAGIAWVAGDMAPQHSNSVVLSTPQAWCQPASS